MNATVFKMPRCPYYPCHKNIPAEKFMCIFCYCPLYYSKRCLGIRNGVAKYVDTPNGRLKDCSDCTVVHNSDNYELVISAVTADIKDSTK